MIKILYFDQEEFDKLRENHKCDIMMVNLSSKKGYKKIGVKKRNWYKVRMEITKIK